MPFITQCHMSVIGMKDDRPLFEQLAPLVYLAKNGKKYMAETYFQHDACSVPRHPYPIYGAFGNKLIRPGVIHDRVYRKDGGLTREEADDLFLEMCEEENRFQDVLTRELEASDIGVRLMYDSIRAGGESSFHVYDVYHRFVDTGHVVVLGQ